jgi:L-tyrosine isonitrile synthase
MSDQEAESGSDSISDLLLRELGPNDAPVRHGSPGRSKPSSAAASGAGRPAKKTPHHPNPPRHKGKVPAEKVMHAFNTWAFKREQPDNPLLMLQIIAHSIAVDEPIPFVLYWGKGPRGTLGASDVECMEYLASLARRVRDAYPPGAAIKLIFTDTHAALNNHSQSSILAYFAEIEACAHRYGFGHCWLSQLTLAAEALAAMDLPDDPAPDHGILEQLAAAAAKWYFGDETPERAALAYYKMNMAEKRAVEIACPRSIFITFNGSRLRILFPKRLPIFYMYSLRRGVSVKPWFYKAEPAH